MKITEAAASAIIDVMLKKGLNPKTFFLEIGIFEGDLGLGFTKDIMGKIIHIGSLRVVVRNNVKADNVMMDFGEVNGRKGLIFIEEKK